MLRVKFKTRLAATLLTAGFFLFAAGAGWAIGSFDPAVLDSLGKMGCSPSDLLSWGEEVPGSCLFTVWAWPAARQREAAALALHIRSVNPGLTPRASWRMAGAFVVASVRFGLPLDLAVAVARAESGFNPAAKSRAGATGVMQVRPDVHRDLLAFRFGAPEAWSLVDPEKAVLAGCFLLAGYLREEGTVERALSRYLGAPDSSYAERVSRYRKEISIFLGR